MNAEQIAEMRNGCAVMRQVHGKRVDIAYKTTIPELLEEIERLKRERLSMIADITVLEAKLEKSIKRSEEFFRKLNE